MQIAPAMRAAVRATPLVFLFINQFKKRPDASVRKSGARTEFVRQCHPLGYIPEKIVLTLTRAGRSRKQRIADLYHQHFNADHCQYRRRPHATHRRWRKVVLSPVLPGKEAGFSSLLAHGGKLDTQNRCSAPAIPAMCSLQISATLPVACAAVSERGRPDRRGRSASRPTDQNRPGRPVLQAERPGQCGKSPVMRKSMGIRANNPIFLFIERASLIRKDEGCRRWDAFRES